MGPHQPIIDAIDEMLAEREPERLRPVLHPRCRWDDCADADAVIRTMTSMLRHGAVVTSWSMDQLDDRVVLDVHGSLDGHEMSAHFAMIVAEEAVVDIVATDDPAAASTVLPPEPPRAPTQRATMNSVAAILPCADVGAAIGHYARLGFEVHAYEGDAAYGFANRGHIALHLAQVHDLDPLTNTSAAYLYVDDADALHAEWVNSGAGGRFRQPEDTPYSLREGAHIDPDGNLLRYGSPKG